jgi:gliding motility-associated-like protein
LVPQKLRLSVTATPLTGNPPLEVQFSNFTTGSNDFLWNFGDGGSSTEENPSHTYLKTGKYYVTLTSFYSLNCQQTDTVAIIDVPGDTPNIITPNGDGSNQFFRSETRPNPVKLQIFNRWGKLVHESADYHDDWSGNGQPDGIYYYQLTAADGQLRKGWLEIIR